MDGWMDRDMAAALDNIYPSKRAAAALQFKKKEKGCR